MGIESAAAAIDFAGLIDEAVRNKNGREESTPRRRSSMASKSMKLLLPNESRLSCGALKKDSLLNVRAPSASSAC